MAAPLLHVPELGQPVQGDDMDVDAIEAFEPVLRLDIGANTAARIYLISHSHLSFCGLLYQLYLFRFSPGGRDECVEVVFKAAWK